jgi:hypothetical protein
VSLTECRHADRTGRARGDCGTDEEYTQRGAVTGKPEGTDCLEHLGVYVRGRH